MEEAQISLNKDFKTAATALSQMYKEAVQQHRSGFNSGVRHVSDRLCQFMSENTFYVDTKHNDEKQRVISADQLCHFLAELHSSIGTENPSSIQNFAENINNNNNNNNDNQNNNNVIINKQHSNNDSQITRSPENNSTEEQMQPMDGKDDHDNININNNEDDDDDDDEVVSEEHQLQNHHHDHQQNDNKSSHLSLHNTNNINGDQDTQVLSEQMNLSFGSSRKYNNYSNIHNDNQNNSNNNNNNNDNNNYNNSNNNNHFSYIGNSFSPEELNFKSFSSPFRGSSPFNAFSSRTQNTGTFRFSPQSNQSNHSALNRRKQQQSSISPVFGNFRNEEQFKNGRKRSFVSPSAIIDNEPPTKRKRFFASLLKH